MNALFYLAIAAKLLSIPAFLIAGVKIVNAITPGPICPACEAGEHDTILTDLNHSLYKCECHCRRAK
jgi:hypothetical protein